MRDCGLQVTSLLRLGIISAFENTNIFVLSFVELKKTSLAEEEP